MDNKNINKSNKSMSNNKAPWVLVIILVVLFVGYVVYDKPPATTPDATDQETSSEDVSEDQDTSPQLSFPDTVSEQERDALSPPPDGSSPAEVRAYRQLLSEVAAETTTFTIDNCEPENPVIKIRSGDEVTIQNNGPTTFVDFNDESYTLERGDTVSQQIGDGTVSGVGYFSVVCWKDRIEPINAGIVWSDIE